MRVAFLFFIALFVSLVGIAQHENHTTPKDTVVKAKSPRTESMALIGENHVHIKPPGLSFLAMCKSTIN